MMTIQMRQVLNGATWLVGSNHWLVSHWKRRKSKILKAPRIEVNCWNCWIRHDDELVEALTGRLKNTTTKTTDSDPITSSSTAQLQSKESINEIKQLRHELSQQQTKYYELQGQLAQAKTQLSKVLLNY